MDKLTAAYAALDDALMDPQAEELAAFFTGFFEATQDDTGPLARFYRTLGGRFGAEIGERSGEPVPLGLSEIILRPVIDALPTRELAVILAGAEQMQATTAPSRAIQTVIDALADVLSESCYRRFLPA